MFDRGVIMKPSMIRKALTGARGERGAGELTLVLIAAAVCIVVIALAKVLGLI